MINKINALELFDKQNNFTNEEYAFYKKVLQKKSMPMYITIYDFMRDATDAENKDVNQYIESISINTGYNFWDYV